MSLLRDISHSIYDHLIEAFPADRNYSRTAFEQEPMPSLVTHFLVQTLQRSVDLEIEQLREARSNWFDYDHPDLQNAQRALEAALTANVRIPRDEWTEKLARAVDDVTSYLVRPTHTLVNFVFQDDDETLPVSIIQRRMAYFGAYAYLREVVRAYTEQKGIRELDSDRFDTLLTQSDRRLSGDYDTEEWLRLLAPLFEYLRTVQKSTFAGIPIDLLVTFYEEKGADRIVSRLQRYRTRTGSRAIDEQGLRQLLEMREETRSEEPVAKPAQERPRQHTPEPRSHPVKPEAEQQNVPLWQQFRQGVPQQRPVARPEPPKKPAPRKNESHGQEQAAQGSDKVPLWMQFRKTNEPSDSAAAPHTRDRTVLGATGPKNRDLFIQHLFSGNEAEYERVLALLEKASTWSEASRIVAEEIFRKHQVNIYSDPAITFTDALEARYRR